MKNTRSTLMLVATFAGMLFTHTASADDSVDHSAKASKHSVLAGAEGLASTATVASAVVAVPVVLTGSVVVAAGSAVAESAHSVASSAHHSHKNSHQRALNHNAPLVVTETVITADPAPNKVASQKTKQVKVTTTINR